MVSRAPEVSAGTSNAERNTADGALDLSEDTLASLAAQLAPRLAELAKLPPPLLDADGAARLLNVPATWVLAEARASRIPHARFGRYVRFDVDELRAWVATRGKGPRR